MSFRFTWPKFDVDFVEQAKLQIEGALNNGGLPSTIVGNIRVTDLHLGSQVRSLAVFAEKRAATRLGNAGNWGVG